MNTRRRRIRAEGFTLVELLIVILVLAIAAGIVIPSIGSAADSQAVSAARVLQSDLETARSLALTTQQPYSLVFSPDLQSYKVLANYTGGPYSSAVAVAHPIIAGRLFEVNLADQNAMGAVRIVSAAFGSGAYVTFTSQGDPVAAGIVVLQSKNTRMQISVQELTGRVTVARLGG